MRSSIQLAGHACAYVKELTNFQNKNPITPKSQKRKKKEKKNRKQGNIVTNNIIKNKPKNSIIQ